MTGGLQINGSFHAWFPSLPESADGLIRLDSYIGGLQYRVHRTWDHWCVPAWNSRSPRGSWKYLGSPSRCTQLKVGQREQLKQTQTSQKQVVQYMYNCHVKKSHSLERNLIKVHYKIRVSGSWSINNIFWKKNTRNIELLTKL